MKIFNNLIYLVILSIFLNGCIKKGFFKRSDVKDNPVNVEERVKKIVEILDSWGTGGGIAYAAAGGSQYRAPHPNHASRSAWIQRCRPRGPVGCLMMDLRMIGAYLSEDLNIVMPGETDVKIRTCPFQAQPKPSRKEPSQQGQ